METRAAFKALRQTIRKSQHLKRGQRGTFRRHTLQSIKKSLGDDRAVALYRSAASTVEYDPTDA